METIILIFMMTGWVTLFFVIGCALESAKKKLRRKRSSISTKTVPFILKNDKI